jgi:hypothetical protein
MQEDDYAESISEFVTRNDEILDEEEQRYEEFVRLLNALFAFQSELMKFKSSQDRMLFVKLELEDSSSREKLENDIEDVTSDSENVSVKIDS